MWPHGTFRLYGDVSLEDPARNQSPSQRQKAPPEHQPKEPVHEAEPERPEQALGRVLSGLRASSGSVDHAPPFAMRVP